MDSFGNVLCESDERDAGSRFQISISAEGQWALKNESRGYFLGGNPDKLVCTAKTPSKSEFWIVHLAARPQVSSIFFFFVEIKYVLLLYTMTIYKE